MNKKLIVSDIDGTILDSNSKLDQSVVEALDFSKKHGAMFTLASGRSLNGVLPLAKKLDVTAPLILSNGAIIHDLKENKNIFKKDIPKDIAKKVVRTLRQMGAFFYFYDETSLYTTKIAQAVAYYDDMNKKGKTNLPIHVFDDLEEASQNYEMLKVVIYEDGKSNFSEIKQALKPLEKDIVVTSSAPWNMEITSSDLSKGKSVEHLAKYLGIKKENVMCIGDELNDYSMLEVAGFAVAMGNANTALKDIAHYVTDDNDNHGFSKAVYKFVEA